MFSTSVFMNVLILTASFLIGILFYYVMIEDTRKNKKQQIDQFLSQLINFIIYIWLGKILVKFTTFINDPLAVLAYPSNSTAFTVATALILFHIFVKYRSLEEQLQLFETLTPILLVAQFIYQFLQTTIIGIKPNWFLLALYMVLIILYALLRTPRDEIRRRLLSFVIAFLGLVGHIVLETFSVTSLYGYHLGIVYYVGLLILVIVIFVYSNKRIRN